jgi:hypothetical protein
MQFSQSARLTPGGADVVYSGCAEEADRAPSFKNSCRSGSLPLSRQRTWLLADRERVFTCPGSSSLPRQTSGKSPVVARAGWSRDEEAEVRRQRCLSLRAASRALSCTAEPGPDRPARYSRQGFRLTLTADRHSFAYTRSSLCETRGSHIRGGERSDSTAYSQPRAQGRRERPRGDGSYDCGLSTFQRSVGKALGTLKPTVVLRWVLRARRLRGGCCRALLRLRRCGPLSPT